MIQKTLSLLAMEKLLKSAGAPRVSEGAKQELKRVIEKKANDISLKAMQLAKNAGRKTVRAEDIKFAVKR